MTTTTDDRRPGDRGPIDVDADWLDREPAEVWEPWVPAVGDRVRLRVNPECPTRDDGVLELDGIEAVVDLVVGHDFPGIDPGHRFGIMLPDGRHGMSAAAELIPIDRPAPADPDAGGSDA